MTASGFSAALAGDANDDHDHRWAGIARVIGPAWARLPSLTVGLFGVQMLWSVEMSYASPYLLSLGLSKSLMAIVFLAGPLSGLIVQPVIGILADNSKSRFGRRRPFIMVCATLCAFATLLLGFTRPFATMFTTLNSPSNDRLTIWLAILAIYCLDFCINAVQALDRALLVDTIPTAKQPAGNAWAARMLAIGSVTGFFVGNLDLPHLFPFFGRMQLEVLSVIAALLLFATQAWVCFHVKERVLLSSSSVPRGLGHELKELWETLARLPSVIRQICWIQFFASLGWFPVLFYTTVYIGDLHKKSMPVPDTQEAAIALDAESTRLGTRALLYSALVSLAANIIIPFFVVSQRAVHAASPVVRPKTWLECVQMHLASLWAVSHLVFALCMAGTFVASNVAGATLIMSITGFCWAMAQWAPFALLGEAILSYPVAATDGGTIHLTDTRVMRSREGVEQYAEEEETWRLLVGRVGEEEEGEDVPKSQSVLTDAPRPRVTELGNARARISRIDVDVDAPLGVTGMTTSGLSAQAGAIIGIHNMFIVVPQFLVTGLSSIIFALFDLEKSVAGEGDSAAGRAVLGRVVLSEDGPRTGPDSLVIIFRLGGIAAAVAFILAYRLAKQLSRPSHLTY